MSDYFKTRLPCLIGMSFCCSALTTGQESSKTWADRQTDGATVCKALSSDSFNNVRPKANYWYEPNNLDKPLSLILANFRGIVQNRD
jgi:hypothetical protein